MTFSKCNLWQLPGMIVTIGILFFIMGCETHFDPMQENDRYPYSLHGFLDVHADTQWIRVMPVLDTLLTQSSEPLNVKVSLVRESTEKTVTLNDSLFNYSGLATAWNFWTTEPIRPEEEYTLWVETPDEENPRVIIRTPGAISVPLVVYTEGDEKGTVYGTGVENLVVAETKFRIYTIDGSGEASAPFWVILSHLDNAQVRANGDYSFTVDAWPLLEAETMTPRNRIGILYREVLVASGSEDWPDLSGLDEESIILPEVGSNVVHGTGIVAGIASRRVPLKSCFDNEDELIACDEIDEWFWGNNALNDLKKQGTRLN